MEDATDFNWQNAKGAHAVLCCKLERDSLVGDTTRIRGTHAQNPQCSHEIGVTSLIVILDLSWPKNTSVNDGVEKNAYLGSEFKLTFPTIDHLTSELVKLGKGAHIFKVDISHLVLSYSYRSF